MRVVTGTVSSSKPISLSKASAILSRFAAADIGARRDVAAYLKRASAAFEDLVQVHRELRSSRKRAVQGVEESEEETSRRKNKEKGGYPNPRENLQAEVKLEEVLEEEEAEAEERRNKKKIKTKKKKEREDGSSKIHKDGNLTEGEGNIEERWDLEKNYAELNGKVEVEVEEEEGYRSAERRKKKKKEKRDREVVENGGGQAEEGSERREKKRRRKTGIEE